jgi:tricorn protease-like protein
MVPDFKQMYSSKEAAEAAIKKFKFKFKADRPPGSISIEDAKKAEQEFNIVSADSEEGKIITEKLIGKPKAPVTELVTAEKIILDMKNMDPMDAMKEANKVLKREGKYKNLKEEDVERIMEDTNDFIFGRDIPEDPEGFAKGGRVGMAGGSITGTRLFNGHRATRVCRWWRKHGLSG